MRLPNYVKRDLSQYIEGILSKSGIFYRIFIREKTELSIKYKINKKKYDSSRKMQDLLGIRIVLYFYEDEACVIDLLSKYSTPVETVIDEDNEYNFKPTRKNIIFNLPVDLSKEVAEFSEKFYDNKIDATYEVQVRTIFSEGWHEVEHDLRYKCSNDWEKDRHLERKLNAIYASLQSSEWGMESIFQEMAYSAYKEKKWNKMLRHKFKLRINFDDIDKSILDLLNTDNDFAKDLYRCDRSKIINILSTPHINIPLTADNLIFVSNFFGTKNKNILDLTPNVLIDILENINN